MTIESNPERKPRLSNSTEYDLDIKDCWKSTLIANTRGDIESSEAWLEKAAEMDDPSACYVLGILARNRGDIQKSRELLAKAAKLGYPVPAEALRPLNTNGEKSDDDWGDRREFDNEQGYNEDWRL